MIKKYTPLIFATITCLLGVLVGLNIKGDINANYILATIMLLFVLLVGK